MLILIWLTLAQKLEDFSCVVLNILYNHHQPPLLSDVPTLSHTPSFDHRVEERLIEFLLTIHNGMCQVTKRAFGHKVMLNPQHFSGFCMFLFSPFVYCSNSHSWHKIIRKDQTGVQAALLDCTWQSSPLWPAAFQAWHGYIPDIRPMQQALQLRSQHGGLKIEDPLGPLRTEALAWYKPQETGRWQMLTKNH